jgi:hypothetical protein
MTISPIKTNTRYNPEPFSGSDNASTKMGGNIGQRAFSNRSYRRRFDFEIGYFVKSPCKSCDIRQSFPGCLDSCETLDKIHSLLIESISSTRRG